MYPENVTVCSSVVICYPALRVRHMYLLHTNITVSPFAMWPAFPSSDYYELIRLPIDRRFSYLSTQYTTCSVRNQLGLGNCSCVTLPPASLQSSQVLNVPLDTLERLRRSLSISSLRSGHTCHGLRTPPTSPQPCL